MHPWDAREDAHDLFALLLEKFQIVPENLERKRTFGASHGFSDVVFDRLREVPDRARVLLHGPFHGGDQFFLILVEDGTPLVVWLQVNEILSVSEPPGIGT